MHEVLVNCLVGLTLPRTSVVRLTDRPNMTLDVYRGRKTQCNNNKTKKTRFHVELSTCISIQNTKILHCALGKVNHGLIKCNMGSNCDVKLDLKGKQCRSR